MGIGLSFMIEIKRAAELVFSGYGWWGFRGGISGPITGRVTQVSKVTL